MAEKKKVLLVVQEVKPFTEYSEMSELVFDTVKSLQEKGADVRILMPRIGLVNERRHRLHEVVRLSGMNIVVDDDDYPLIIKVASLTGTKSQVYFLDNEEFFKRKEYATDAEGKLHEDNIDRALFFAKSVVETVKKFGWSPDVVHIHGWIGSFLPAYLHSQAKHEPVFQNAKLVYSLYESGELGKAMGEKFKTKAAPNMMQEALANYQISETDSNFDSEVGAIRYCDGVVQVSGDENLLQYAAEVLPRAQMIDDIMNFYNKLSTTEAILKS